MTFEVAGEAYDRFMGRYSKPLAARFADWLEVTQGQRAVDVGCGPGALTEQLVARLGADHVSAIDPSPPFVEACRARFPGVDVRQGGAESLPFDDGSHDVAGACLVVHFMTDPVGGVAEMRRVTREGGWVGATVWDLAGSRAPMAPLWTAVAEVAPEHPDESDFQGGSRGQPRLDPRGCRAARRRGRRAGGDRHPPDLRGVVGALPARRRSGRRGRRGDEPRPPRAGSRRSCGATSATGRSTSRRWRGPVAGAPDRPGRGSDGRPARGGASAYAGRVMMRSLLLRCRNEA